MSPQKYAGDHIAKVCKVANMHDESTHNDLFIKEIDSAIRHSLRNNCATRPIADQTDIAFLPESLLTIQKRPGKCADKQSTNNHIQKAVYSPAAWQQPWWK